MPSDHNHRDRKEAARLLLATALAILLLIVIGGAGLYYILGMGQQSDPFSAGLGLKGAAVISFGVSLVVILIMALVYGGDAIFGELPFTIAGFLLFFLIFWLMIAWIF
jgi:hypothetical protein